MVFASPCFTAVTMYPPCKTVLARSACSVLLDYSSNKTICGLSFIIAGENCFSFVIDTTKQRGILLEKQIPMLLSQNPFIQQQRVFVASVETEKQRGIDRTYLKTVLFSSPLGRNCAQIQ